MINTKITVSEIECKLSNGQTFYLPTREVMKQYSNYLTSCLETKEEMMTFEAYIDGHVKG